MFVDFVNDFVEMVVCPQARWRDWPEGQLDPAPPQGCSCVGPMSKPCKYLQLLNSTRPAGQSRRRARKVPDEIVFALSAMLALSWPS